MTDPNEVIDALTLGGGALAGMLSALALAAYRKRKKILALDTVDEVAALLGILAPVAAAAWVAMPEAWEPEKRVGAALIVAIGYALRMNTGPLGDTPEERDSDG